MTGAIQCLSGRAGRETPLRICYATAHHLRSACPASGHPHLAGRRAPRHDDPRREFRHKQTTAGDLRTQRQLAKFAKAVPKTPGSQRSRSTGQTHTISACCGTTPRTGHQSPGLIGTPRRRAPRHDDSRSHRASKPGPHWNDSNPYTLQGAVSPRTGHRSPSLIGTRRPPPPQTPNTRLAPGIDARVSLERE